MSDLQQQYLEVLKANGDVAIMNARLQADLIDLRGAAIDLLNQLALLTRDDESYLWRIGGRPLDEAYRALGRAVADTQKASNV